MNFDGLNTENLLISIKNCLVMLCNHKVDVLKGLSIKTCKSTSPKSEKESEAASAWSVESRRFYSLRLSGEAVSSGQDPAVSEDSTSTEVDSL